MINLPDPPPDPGPSGPDRPRDSVDELKKRMLVWLGERLDSPAFEKIETAARRMEGAEEWELFTSFSSVPRWTGKSLLGLSSTEEDEADRLVNGWKPGRWSLDQLGRTLLVLSLARRGKEKFFDLLEKLFLSADAGEQVALYQALAVLPWPEEHQRRAAEGIRSNMSPVFQAVALHNPWPALYFPEDAWNQMILKALFIGVPLWQVEGIDRRRNEKLAGMLIDFAQERWSAGREVPPELWRMVAPFMDDDRVRDIARLLHHPEELQRQTALLALTASELPSARTLLEAASRSGQLKNLPDWDEIGRRAAALSG